MSELTIRHSTPADLRGIKAIYSQRHAYGNTLQLPYPSSSLWEKRLSNSSENNISLVAEIGDEIVGQLTLVVNEHPRRKHVATFGMGVSADHTGKGIGSQLLEAALDLADNWLQIRRVEIEVYTDNESAIALYRKHAFEVEGECREYAFREGRYVDAYLMARLME
jgi:putative acetyltransferase